MYHYNKGDTLGPLNITYIKEDVPYIRPDGRKERKGIFVCPFCEKEFSATFYHIRTGATKSCGCYRRQMTIKRNKQNLVGKKFGKLTVLKEDGINQNGKTV